MSDVVDILMQVAKGELASDDPNVGDALSQAHAMQIASSMIPAHSPQNPKMAIIGDTVDRDEAEAHCLFAGQAGDELTTWVAKAGILLSDVYLDKVYPVPNAKDLSEEMRQAYRADCIERVGHPEVIVLLGNEALKTFLPYDSAMKHRGGQYLTKKGSVIIPMLDPRAVMRNTQWRRRSIFDMQMAKQVIRSGYTPPTNRDNQLVRVNADKSTEYAEHTTRLLFALAGKSDCEIAIDIETAALDDCITCVGFSGSPDWSVTFEWPDEENRGMRADSIRTWVSELCESPCKKVFHNGCYDVWWLKRYAGITVNNWTDDTMCMAQAWYPADNISLEYLTSICTDIPYYKDEGKDHFKHKPKTDADWNQLMTYCGLDCTATIEIFYWLDLVLKERRRRDFYLNMYPPKWQPMMDLMLNGVRIDSEKRREHMGEFLSAARKSRDGLAFYNDGEPLFTLTTERDKRVYARLRAGENPYTTMKTAKTTYSMEEVDKSIAVINEKTVSNTKLQGLLYDKLRLPLQTERRANGTETPTVGNLTLRKLLLKFGTNSTVHAAIFETLNHRRMHKLAEFCYDSMEDGDGRMRFSLKLTPETGRFASSKAPNGTGKNSQNLPRDRRIRELILPEPGHVLLKADLSQVEARFCFMYTRHPELITLANAKPGGYDQHSANAVLLGLAKTVEEAQEKKSPRQTAKAIVHGAQRNMQAETLYDTLLKDADLDLDIIIPPVEECEEKLELYHTRYPAIRGVFFEETRRKMHKDRWLENSWGRRWGLDYEDLDEEAMRRAFSFILQSEAADLINEQGFLPMHDWLRHNNRKSRIMLHAHDELVFSCPPKEVYAVARELQRNIETPRIIEGNELVVPIEFGLGSSWAVEKEWKVLPSEDEVYETAKQFVQR